MAAAIMVGESLVGEGNEVAHVDLLIGSKSGPVGAAFFLWDSGTKHGNLPLLGVFSYAAPVLSTLLLAAAGAAEPICIRAMKPPFICSRAE